RLRRHHRGPHGGRAAQPAGRVRPDQGGGGPARGHPARALHRAHQLGDRRGPELRGRDGGPGPAGVEPTVVNDQIGRLTFAGELAAAIDALLSRQAPWGLYNVTGGGRPLSWAELAAEIFRLCGREPSAVTPVSTQTYLAGREGTAPRPHHSVLDLQKIRRIGYQPPEQLASLTTYVAALHRAAARTPHDGDT